MTEREETVVTATDLLPPGVHPVWSPYDAYEAAALLMAALVEGKTAPTPSPSPPQQSLRKRERGARKGRSASQ